MDVQHLIQAHKLYANWSRTGPEVDLDNAYSMTFLSMASAASLVELQERRTALEAIWKRQSERAREAEAKLVANGANPEALMDLVMRVSEAVSTATLKFTLAHLMAHHDPGSRMNASPSPSSTSSSNGSATS